MNRNWIVVGIMALVLAAMVWVGLRESKNRPAGNGIGAGSVAGASAPDFQLRDVSTHKPVRLSDFRGKAVLLNFWATWCPPCKMEIPWFVDLQKQYGPDGLVVLGVAMDDASEQEIADFAKNMGVNYPILKGTDDVGNEYGGVDALPTTFYIGRDGRIVSRVFGLRSHGEVEKQIKAALATPSAPSTADARTTAQDNTLAATSGTELTSAK